METQNTNAKARYFQICEKQEAQKYAFYTNATINLMEQDDNIKARAEAMFNLGVAAVKSYRDQGVNLTYCTQDGKVHTTMAKIDVDYSKEANKDKPIFFVSAELRCNPYEDKSTTVLIKLQANSNLDKEGNARISSVRSAEFKGNSFIKSLNNVNAIINEYKNTGIDKALTAIAERGIIDRSSTNSLKSLSNKIFKVFKEENGIAFVPEKDENGKRSKDPNAVKKEIVSDCYLTERLKRDKNGKEIKDKNGMPQIEMINIYSHSCPEASFRITEDEKTGYRKVSFRTSEPSLYPKEPEFYEDGTIKPYSLEIDSPDTLEIICEAVNDITGNEIPPVIVKSIAEIKGFYKKEFEKNDRVVNKTIAPRIKPQNIEHD